MRYNAGYNREGEYDHYVVQEPMPLLEWLLQNVPQTKTKIKATLLLFYFNTKHKLI